MEIQQETTNKRGQLIDDVKKSVEKGSLYENQFMSYMKNKYNITLNKHKNQFNCYDFTIENKPNIFIEYKALQIRKVINNQPYYYEYVYIPKSKIDNFIKLYDDGLKNNTLIRFFYIISLYYKIDGIQYKKHEYYYLDLYKIKYECEIIDKILGDYDDEPHYKLKHTDFIILKNFPNIINQLTTD